MIKLLKTLFILVLSCSLACSKVVSVESKPVVNQQTSPLEVQVTQAFYVGTDLNVKIKLLALNDISSNDVVIAIKGLEEGKSTELAYKQLSSEYLDVIFNKGKVALIHLTIPGLGLTEYQVICSWGDDAKKFLIENSKVEKIPENKKNLILHSVEIERISLKCDLPPCNEEIIIHADLVNLSNIKVSEIKLALGLHWVNQGSLPQVPEQASEITPNEELINLNTLIIEPGAKKPLKIKVDKQIPTIPGGAFIPHLRILGYNSELK